MCGIAGLAVAPSYHASDLQPAVRAIAHRGPDGNGTHLDQDFALVHTRLAIIDLSPSGAQPMVSANQRYVLVYNGEIYSFMQLRRTLEARGVVFRGTSDTEVLLEGYAHFGPDVLDHLDGIFAFAIADLQARELFLARDHLGIKPLYWSEGAFGFAFASEIKALLTLAPISRELDVAALRRYVTFLWCPGDGTPLKAVRKLDPGSAMIVRAGRIARRWRFWKPPTYQPRLDWTQKECAEELATTLERAVKRQMVSDAPVGALLSGGVDSTAVVAAARQSAPGLHCFTMQMVGAVRTEMDEDLAFAQVAARSLGVPLTQVRIEPSDIVNNIEKMVFDLDEPLADPASLSLFFMARAAREQGIKVLLSGAGGDDIMSGYRRHTAAAYNGAWDVMPLGARKSLARASRGWGQSNRLLRRASKLFGHIDETTNDRLISLFAWTPDAVLEAVLDQNRFGNTSSQDSWCDMRAEISMDPNAPDMEKCLRLDRRFFLADHNLIYTDKMGMAAGVEIRVPLLDIELVNFASHIPAQWKHRGLVAKWMFKQSQRNMIPKQIIDRPKRGFGVPLRLWMKDGMRKLRDDLLSPECINKRGLFDARAVAQLLEDNDAGRSDASYSLFSMMCIEVWCRRFVDAEFAPVSGETMYESRAV